jgi:predicted DNA-binding antitoxin AbrB/MazE fold protein
MSHVEAIYQGGVFKPLTDVVLPENQRVSLQFEPVRGGDWETWLAEARELKKRVTERHGLLPDSTPDIAADRMR